MNAPTTCPLCTCTLASSFLFSNSVECRSEHYRFSKKSEEDYWETFIDRDIGMHVTYYKGHLRYALTQGWNGFNSNNVDRMTAHVNTSKWPTLDEVRRILAAYHKTRCMSDR